MTTGEITTRPTLSRLTETGKAIQALLLNPDIQDKETLQKALGEVEGQWLTKVENIGHLCKDMDYLIDNFMTEIAKLENQARVLANRKAWLLDYLMVNMIASNETKLQFPLVAVSIVNNPPSVEIIDEKAIPASYITIKTETVINKNPIRDDLKKGIEVPGARLITDRKRVQIK